MSVNLNPSPDGPPPHPNDIVPAASPLFKWHSHYGSAGLPFMNLVIIYYSAATAFVKPGWEIIQRDRIFLRTMTDYSENTTAVHIIDNDLMEFQIIHVPSDLTFKEMRNTANLGWLIFSAIDYTRIAMRFNQPHWLDQTPQYVTAIRDGLSRFRHVSMHKWAACTTEVINDDVKMGDIAMNGIVWLSEVGLDEYMACRIRNFNRLNNEMKNTLGRLHGAVNNLQNIRNARTEPEVTPEPTITRPTLNINAAEFIPATVPIQLSDMATPLVI